MAINYHNILRLTVSYILLSFLLSRSTQSINNDVNHTDNLVVQNQARNNSNETDVLTGLKDVLNKVKKKIFEIPNAKEDAISPTPTVGDNEVNKSIVPIKETYQTLEYTRKYSRDRTPYNWFTIVDLGSTQTFVTSKKRTIERKIQSTKKKEQYSKDVSMQPEERKENQPIKHKINATSPDNTEISEEALTESISINLNHSQLNNISSNDKHQLETNQESHAISVEEPNKGILQDDTISGINMSYEPSPPIVLDTVTIVTDIPNADGTKPSDGAKIETYSQFAERLSAEKKNGSPDMSLPMGIKSSTKVKTKNYASQDCGAKLLTANPGAEFPGHIINPNKDEYMLNKCNLETYFVIIELCESIRTQKFDVANFELFSNVPKDMRLYGSHRYPAREWISIGEFQGEEGNRGVQSFVTNSDKFIKYVKLEVISHYGSEFYCPLSLFRIFGISEYEAIDHLEDEAEELEEEQTVTTTQAPKASGWDLRSLMGKVLSVIKRGSISYKSDVEQDEINSFTMSCRSLQSNFAIQAENCPAQEYINYILSCYYQEYLMLLQHDAIAAIVKNNSMCNFLSQSVCGTPTVPDQIIYNTLCRRNYLCVMLSPKHLMALCYLAHPGLLQNGSNCQSEELYISGAVVNNDTIEYKNTIKSTNSTIKLPLESSPEQEERHLPNSARSDKNEPVTVVGGEETHGVISDHAEKVTNESASGDVPSGSIVYDEPIKPRPQNNTFVSPDNNMESATTSEVKLSSHSSANKESIVVRLSNKIKVLEENMSISSQYLEELSQTYKRQMEDMQRQFNMTITALNKSSQIAFDRDLIHHELIGSLQERLQSINQTVEGLIDWNHYAVIRVFVIHCIFMLIEIALLFFTYKRFCRRITLSPYRGYGRNPTFENGIISMDDRTGLHSINRSASDTILSSVNYNGYAGRAQEGLAPAENGLRTPASILPQNNDNFSSPNSDVEVVTNSNSTENFVQNDSSHIPTSTQQNVGLLNASYGKQVIPFRVDQHPGYEFSYSNADFNAPVITDYYSEQCKTGNSALRSVPNYSLPSHLVPFNCEGFQSYMQWCYQQSLQSVSSTTNLVGVSESDSRSTKSSSRIEQTDSSIFTNGDITPTVRSGGLGSPSAQYFKEDIRCELNLVKDNISPILQSQDALEVVAIQNLDSKFDRFKNGNSELKSSICETPFPKQELNLHMKSHLSVNGSQEKDFGNLKFSNRDLVSKKLDNPRKNRKRKSKSKQIYYNE